MTSTSSQGASTSQESSTSPQLAGVVSPDTRENDPEQKHVHHGKTPAAWVGAMAALVAFLIGGVAMVLGPLWILFWIAVAIAAVGLIAAMVLQRKGYGAD
jgi:cytosine/uracil/thiamine/allantoin permease